MKFVLSASGAKDQVHMYVRVGQDEFEFPGLIQTQSCSSRNFRTLIILSHLDLVSKVENPLTVSTGCSPVFWVKYFDFINVHFQFN